MARYHPPAMRRLRIYAFDPHAALTMTSAQYARATIAIPWEGPGEEPLSPGPVNDYLEIVDYDPASAQFYEGVDLSDPHLLAQDGLEPAEGNPQFHQQMVFAVAMKTIRLFERALGRKMLWASDFAPGPGGAGGRYVLVKKLRVYPHALREANAYYSPSKKALLFGYFRTARASAGASWIFTALSHDIIVHEVTHALLDGIHRRYAEPTSVDSLAFHEAFSDIIALFSHFTIREAVYDNIRSMHGALDREGVLSGLAAQFAAGTSGRTSLRQFIGDPDVDADLLSRATQAHERGAILVAAVFDAFLKIYQTRTDDLMRIAGRERGSEGRRLDEDLAMRLTNEAVKSAEHVMRMCIRALDYMPPVDVRFGEFLRGIITADMDLVPDDRLNYRLAFSEAFRRRGILADDCISMSPDNLVWDSAEEIFDQLIDHDTHEVTAAEMVAARGIADIGLDLVPHFDREKIFEAAEGDPTQNLGGNRQKIWTWLVRPDLQVKAGAGGAPAAGRKTRALRAFIDRHWGQLDSLRSVLASTLPVGGPFVDVGLDIVRGALGALPPDQAKSLSDAIENTGGVVYRRTVDEIWERAIGVFFRMSADAPKSVKRTGDHPSVEIHSVRTTRRMGPDGQDIRQLVIEVMQKRQGFFDPAEQARRDAEEGGGNGDFVFRGGATLIIDLRDYRLRYIIRKPIDDMARLERQRAFAQSGEAFGFTYTQPPRANVGANALRSREPFGLAHRGG